MLSHYLTKALEDLGQLINLTHDDIADIKLAHHEKIFERAKIKEELITSFQNKKVLIDSEIAKQMESNPSVDLEELLNEETQEFLGTLKTELSSLKELNKRYAKLVLSVSEFYNSLLERMVPVEMHGYEKVTPKHRAILEVRA
ncbi:MAG: hypothetical protein OEW60_03455 [Thiovulaceae bacterium]|nr:hypothetical protein [Sulfurimonadaceae bacterium]